MLDILAVTGPIYLLIALGFVATRRGVFAAADLRVLGQYVMQFALSALVFRAVAQRPFAQILNLHFIGVYALGSLGAWGVGAAIARVRERGWAGAAFNGGGMSISNSGFIGSTLLVPLLGPWGGVALALVLLTENLVMNPLMLTVAEGEGAHHQPRGQVAVQSLLRVLRLPFVVAMLVGLAVSLSGLPLPAVLMRAVDLLAMSASAVALFVIGGTLVGRRVEGQWVPVIGMVLGKLVLHPAAVLTMVLLWPPTEPGLRAGAVLFATMPMFSIYPLLAQRYGLEGFCASVLVATTAVSFVTISAWLWVLRHLLGWI